MLKNKIIKNISWLFFDKFIRVFGSLFIGIWVARYLQPESYGLLNYAIAYTSLFMIFVKMGLDSIVVRELTKNSDSINELLGTAFVMKLFGSVLAILLILVSFIFLEISSNMKIIIFIISLSFIFQTLDVIDYFYQSKILSKYSVISRNMSFLIVSCIKVYLIMEGYSLEYFAIVILIESVLTFLFFIIIYKQTGNFISHWKYNEKLAKKLLRYCWPLAISMFIISIHMRIDQIMIGNMIKLSQVGIYSVAVRLSNSWYFIPSIIISTLLPYFIGLRERDCILYHKRLLQLYSILFWIGVFIAVLVMLFATDIIIMLYGVEYLDARDALVFNIWNGIFVSHALARGIWIINENLQRFKLYNNIIIVVLNIVTNLILIPKIGIAGSAIATLLTQFFGTWVIPLLWRPMRKSTFDLIKSINPKYIFMR